MGNGKRVLPVLHCLKRGIAFVSCFILKFISTIDLGTKTRKKFSERQFVEAKASDIFAG